MVATQSGAGSIGEIVSATIRPRLASMPSRHSAGTSAPRRSMNRANGKRSRSSGGLASGSHTSTSAPSTCGSSAVRHASTEARAPFEPTTIESPTSADELDIHQAVDGLALLEVLRLGVDGPDVELRSVDHVQGAEDRRPHRVVLVVVPVQPVAAEGGEVVETGEVRAEGLDRRPVAQVVHRIGARHTDLDAVDDRGRV